MTQQQAGQALVVDDSPTQAADLCARLTKLGYAVDQVASGQEALAAIEGRMPDFVLSDLIMPGMDGLELVKQIRARWPGLPIVLVTAYGAEETAPQAMRHGAAGYVPKRLFDRDLAKTLEEVLSVARANRTRDLVHGTITRTFANYRLNNDPSMIPIVVSRMQEGLARTRICDENARLRVAMALREALLNAVEHGNLEVSSILRENLDDSYHRQTEERRHQQPYCDRLVIVEVAETADEARYVITDQGPGFDPSKLPDPTDPANLEKASGRGLLLMRSFMDEVHYNSTGNQITLVKRRPAAAQ